MEMDDPLRKLLETTGWSCDDLLEKVQKLKSTQDLGRESPNDQKTIVECNDQIKDSEEYIVESTSELVHSPVSTNRSKNVDFSETDEDEAEVLVTNSNIINEIIEDIFSSDSAEYGNKSSSKNVSQMVQPANDSLNETIEVTEIKVIELDEEDDDDRFEDECHGVDRFTPEKMEELEQLSRELTYGDKALEEMERAVKTICSSTEDIKDVGNLTMEMNNEGTQIQSSPYSVRGRTLSKNIIEITSDSEDNDASNDITSALKNHHDIIIKKVSVKNNCLKIEPNQFSGMQIEDIQSVSSGLTKIRHGFTNNEESVSSVVGSVDIVEGMDSPNVKEINCQKIYGTELLKSDSSSNKDSDLFTHIPKSPLAENNKIKVISLSKLIGNITATKEDKSLNNLTEERQTEECNSNKFETVHVHQLDQFQSSIINNEEVGGSKMTFRTTDTSQDSVNAIMNSTSSEVASYNSNIHIPENNHSLDSIVSGRCTSLSSKVNSVSDASLIEPPDRSLTNADDISLNSNEQSSNDDEESSSCELDSNNETSEISDEIRNTIKIQLNCLRTKKKESFLGTLNTNKITNDKPFFLSTNSSNFNMIDVDSIHLENKLKKKGSKKTTEDSICELEKVHSREGDLEKSQLQENSLPNPNDKIDFDSGQENELYTQTNEFGLVILNVQGGIELDQLDNVKNIGSRSSENSDPQKETSDTLEHTSPEITDKDINTEKNDRVGVFDEIRKIIRKQKSNFTSQDIGSTISNISSNYVVDTEKNCSLLSTANSQIPSAENSQSSFILEESSQPKKKISPFVSNSLDEFLTENSKLNISYNVPKCGAEEGLKEKYEESPLVVNKVVKLKGSMETQSTKAKKVKAKTVAQRRQLLEKLRMREIKEEKLLAEKIKTIKSENRAFVMFENRKIFVVTDSMTENCVAVVDCTKHFKELRYPLLRCRKSKLSLLAQSKQQRKVKYLPGPLCKKPSLQLTGNVNWETEIKTLPKIFLEVSPAIAKPLPLHLWHHLPSQDGSLSTEHIEFALSVVKTKYENNYSRESYLFPVKYSNNQDQVVVRKRKLPSSLPVPTGSSDPLRDRSDSVDTVIKDVIEGLLNYVEIKELAPTLFMEEDVFSKTADEPTLSNSSVDERVNIIKKPLKRKSKIDAELHRLNCKIVNVELENQVETECNKLYCRLGCVCNSLKCDSIINLHCQKYQCMFNCKCPKEKTIILDNKLRLPAGSDIFSLEAVSRIEDEAKKHLAKVERDFTQTVIQTNDKTIILGLGTRSTRRNTKTPIKYTDFVEDNRLLDTQGKKSENPKVLRNCKVELKKLNLSQIVPYCLVHQLHNCHCKGHSLYIKNENRSEVNLEKKKYSEKNSGEIQPKKQKKRKIECTSKETFNKDQTTKLESSPETFSSKGRPIRTIKKVKLDDNFEYSYNEANISLGPMECARVKEIDPCFLKTNDINERMFQNDFIYNVTESDILKYKLVTINEEESVSEAENFKWQLIRDNIRLVYKYQKSKRKNNVQFRKESVDSSKMNNSIIDGAMQRRKKVITAVNKEDIRPVFEGEIVINKTNMELLTRMGPRHVADGYARLLPWTVLVKNFNEGKINVWCMKHQSSKLMMNKAAYGNPPKNYEDIRHAKEKTMIINCILENKLPEGYDQDNVSFILKETKDNYEICGLCAKNVSSETPKVSLGVNQAQFSESMETSFVHRDMLGAQRTLFMKKQKFKLQQIMEEGLKDLGEKSVESSKLYMWAALPELYSVGKWRVIYLNSDFTFLFFKKINYSIKYTDLLSAGITAKEKNYTVILKNIEMKQYYDHKEFGVYFDPHYQDRLFVGPYFKAYNENDIETLRYINGKLVCTESFNKMRGEGDYKCGQWLIERPYRTAVGPTIDLTEDMEENIPNFSTRQRMFLYNHQEVKIIDSVPKAPKDFNRYAITNIPHFGYLGAYQHQNSEVDVQWPFEKKLLRFKNPNHAIEFLQTRFSCLLVSIPESFKIVVVLLTSIDLEVNYPIRTDILNGYHICGDFGIHSISDLTEETCPQKIGFSKEDVIKAFLRNRQNILKDQAKQLATLVEIPENTTNLQMIVKKATRTVKKLHEENRKLANKKSALLLNKKANASQIFKLIRKLPPKQRYEESKKFMAVMNSTEPIEIVDSDDETAGCSGKKNATSTDPLVSKQQSLLKPMKLPVSKGNSVLRKNQSDTRKNNTFTKYIQGVKLVRKSSGKLVLVQDQSRVKKSPLSPGMKVTIKNNKIHSITRTESDINHDLIKEQMSNASRDDEKNDSLHQELPGIDTLKSSQISTYMSRNDERSDESVPIIDLCNENSCISEVKLENDENLNTPTDNT